MLYFLEITHLNEYYMKVSSVHTNILKYIYFIIQVVKIVNFSNDKYIKILKEIIGKYLQSIKVLMRKTEKWSPPRIFLMSIVSFKSHLIFKPVMYKKFLLNFSLFAKDHPFSINIMFVNNILDL